MERLTKYVNGVPVIYTADLDFYFIVNGKIGGDVAARLAAYENTGYTPEEIAALRAENERLHKENFWLTNREG